MSESVKQDWRMAADGGASQAYLVEDRGPFVCGSELERVEGHSWTV